MKKKLAFMLVSFLVPFSGLFAAEAKGVYLQSGSHLRISIETCLTRSGLTPVIVSLADAHVFAVMDGSGRVFGEEKADMRAGAQPFFTIHLAQGRIDLAGGFQNIFVYEKNEVRTRFWFTEKTVALPLRLDEAGESGTLFLGTMEIPVQLSAGENVHCDTPSRSARGGTSGNGLVTVVQLPRELVRIRSSKSEARRGA
jgi:hypothetical protein